MFRDSNVRCGVRGGVGGGRGAVFRARMEELFGEEAAFVGVKFGMVGDDGAVGDIVRREEEVEGGQRRGGRFEGAGDFDEGGGFAGAFEDQFMFTGGVEGFGGVDHQFEDGGELDEVVLLALQLQEGDSLVDFFLQVLVVAGEGGSAEVKFLGQGGQGGAGQQRMFDAVAVGVLADGTDSGHEWLSSK